MPRIIFTANEDMDTDLKHEAKKRGATVAGLLRLYIAQGLATDTGKSLDAYEVERGGDRRTAASDKRSKNEK